MQFSDVDLLMENERSRRGVQKTGPAWKQVASRMIADFLREILTGVTVKELWHHVVWYLVVVHRNARRNNPEDRVL
jgi:hypothetical protein